jgi:NADPH:quinone reductase-like Zn-dependent oxidoreductase
VAGTVHSAGDRVGPWLEGQRVLLQAGQLDRRGTVLTRGVDYDGGWAEYALAREDTLVAIPDDLPFEQACIIPDAVSTPWAAITATGQARPGDPVAVWGAGGLGTHAVQLLRLIGAAPVIAVDPLPAARERALRLGADAALDPGDAGFAERMRELTSGEGLAVAFDFAGVPSVRDQALRCLGRGGKLVLAGIANQPVTIASDAVLNYLQLSVLGHYGSDPEHVLQLVRLARQRRIDLAGSVSAVLPLAEAPAAVARLQGKEGNPIRLVLQP